MSDDLNEVVAERLERERERVERRYTAALVALDAASELPPALLTSASTADADVVRLNQIWGKYAPKHGDRSPGRLARRLVAEVARLLPWRRRALLGAMIAAINRQAETTRALLDATRHFRSHVVWYGQAVTTLASAPRRGELSASGLEAVNAAVNALASGWQQHLDALQARESRYEARMAALTRAYEDLRDVANLAEQRTLAIKRTVDALTDGASGVAPKEATGAGLAPARAPAGDAQAFKYVAFEDRFRGSRDVIRARLADYPPLFTGRSNVVDLGCGRGELLDLFREAGVSARGVDANPELVAACQTRGLEATAADAVTFLEGQPDASLGGLVAIQVVEHLEPAYLMRVLDLAQQKLSPGSPIALETINAACWTAFFDSYIRDFTHARPLHPDTLRYLVQASGFGNAEIRYLSPIPEHDKLPVVRPTPSGPNGTQDPTVMDLVEALNAHAERLNSQLFTYRDFAVIAVR